MGYVRDSYETVIGSHLITKDIKQSIKESIIQDNIDRVNLGVKSDGIYQPIFITGIFQSESKIPLFAHPIAIDDFKDKKYICCDVRLYINKGAVLENINAYVRNKTEFNFAKNRTILNMLWLNDEVNSIKNGTVLASTVYSIWLSNTIARNYALDAKDQLTLTVISNFYYQTLFTAESNFNEEQKQKMAVHTIKATGATGDFVFDVFDRITQMNDINDYIENIKIILENVRLKDFNLAILLTILKNSWYGINAEKIISVAIEHPPTWIAIVHTAMTEKTYKNSTIYKISESFGKRGKSEEFMKSYSQLVNDQLSVESISTNPFAQLDNYE